MPGSSEHFGTRRLLVATMQLVLLGALLWVGEYALVRSNATLHLYRKAFDGSLAHRFAGQLARVESSDTPAVLLLGPSTVREGFSEQTMNRAAPGLRFLNGGSTGSTVFTLEGLSVILDQYSVRPACIVVGLNSRMLVHRKFGLSGQKYTDFMDLFNSGSLPQAEPLELQADLKNELIVNTALPVHRLSRQVNPLIRYGLYRLQQKWSLGNRLPQQAFEQRPGDLNALPEYMYNDDAPRDDRLAVHMKNLEALGLLEPQRYAQPVHLASLRRTLDRCMNASDRVVILVMPERTEIRTAVGRYADAPLSRLLDEYKDRGCTVIDSSTRFEDHYFRDIGHLLPKGRTLLSEEIALLVQEQLRGKSGSEQLAQTRSPGIEKGSAP